MIQYGNSAHVGTGGSMAADNTFLHSKLRPYRWNKL